MIRRPRTITSGSLYKGKNPYEKWKSFERMNHELYKYGAVINYNRNPIIKGKGSAIFLHIWRGENKPTAGCTATSEKNVLSLLKWMDPEKNPHIIMGTYEFVELREIKYEVRPLNVWGFPSYSSKDRENNLKDCIF